MYIRANKSFARLISSILTCAILSLVLMPGFVAYAEDSPPVDSTPAPTTETTTPSDPGAGGQGEPGETAPSSDPAPANGDNGQTGTSGGDIPATNDGQPSDVPATVTTGDASAGTDVQNNENSNTIDTSSSTPTTINASSTADLGNGATTTAATGDNAANGGGGGNASIGTGDALASSNVINVINTNIIDSNGMLLFLNMIMGGTFDLRMFDLSYFFGGGSSGGCTLFGCNNASLTVNANNDATVTNDVIVRADSGGNTATSTGEGTSFINTGNAYASANVLNLINSNFINSNYLLVSLNNFGDLGQDIVLPNADFFQQLLSHNSGLSGQTTVNATNTAQVSNGTNVGAATGDNTASTTGDGSAAINSGNAYAGATTINQVNTNEIGGTHIFLLFRVWGNWTGAIQGLPSGVSWAQTPYGIQLINDSGSSSPESALFGGTPGTCCGNGGSLNVNANNNATVNNNVNVWALTGNNQTNSENGNATINTGNAYAAANTVNFVNTNVIGRNWIFAIFNIFGNWSGNIAFGRPDLWLGATAQANSNPVYADEGGKIAYHFTVSNRGDLDATHVRLSASSLRSLIQFDSGGTANGAEWDLGTIRRGETKDFSFNATVQNVPSEGTTAVPVTATVTSAESDNNPLDNVEQVNVMVARQHRVAVTGAGGVGYFTNDPHISMTKTTATVSTSTPASVDYKLVIKNDGGSAYKTVLTDSMNQPNGKEVYARSWDLDTIKEGEEITLTYTVQFTGDLPPGLYTNVAELSGRRNNPDDRYAVDMTPVEATASVQILGALPKPAEPAVLGASTEGPMCKPILTTYLKMNSPNNSDDVTNLQQFLNAQQGENLDVNGVYNQATADAVKRFQEKYKDEILTPWGISQATGYVYYTTQRKVNVLSCNGNTTFTLAPDQIKEIAKFRRNVRTNGEPLNPEVGTIKPQKGNQQAVIAPTLPKPQTSQVQMPEPSAQNAGKNKKIGNGFFNGFGSWLGGLMPFVDALES